MKKTEKGVQKRGVGEAEMGAKRLKEAGRLHRWSSGMLWRQLAQEVGAWQGSPHGSCGHWDLQACLGPHLLGPCSHCVVSSQCIQEAGRKHLVWKSRVLPTLPPCPTLGWGPAGKLKPVEAESIFFFSQIEFLCVESIFFFFFFNF